MRETFQEEVDTGPAIIFMSIADSASFTLGLITVGVLVYYRFYTSILKRLTFFHEVTLFICVAARFGAFVTNMSGNKSYVACRIFKSFSLFFYSISTALNSAILFSFLMLSRSMYEGKKLPTNLVSAYTSIVCISSTAFFIPHALHNENYIWSKNYCFADASDFVTKLFLGNCIPTLLSILFVILAVWMYGGKMNGSVPPTYLEQRYRGYYDLYKWLSFAFFPAEIATWLAVLLQLIDVMEITQHQILFKIGSLQMVFDAFVLYFFAIRVIQKEENVQSPTSSTTTLPEINDKDEKYDYEMSASNTTKSSNSQRLLVVGQNDYSSVN